MECIFQNRGFNGDCKNCWVNGFFVYSSLPGEQGNAGKQPAPDKMTERWGLRPPNALNLDAVLLIIEMSFHFTVEDCLYDIFKPFLQ